MGRPRKVEVSESKQAVSTPVLRRSTRNKKVVEEVQDGDQGQSASPVLRRSSRKRSAVQQGQMSIFDTPPPSNKKQRKNGVITKKSKSDVIKSLLPPPTLMSLPYEVQERLLRYLDVQSLESLGKTCSHFDLMIYGRFLTTLSLPMEREFLREVKETDTLEKKPLLRLACKKPMDGGNKEEGDWHFMGKFVDSKRGLREYIIQSQMALLTLNKVREIDLVVAGFRAEDLESSMLECFQHFDMIILRQMSSLGMLENISRLEVMIVEDDFGRSLLKDFIPELTNLLELSITIGERKKSLRSYFYGTLEDIVLASKAPLLRLIVKGGVKKKFPKVFVSNHIEKLIVSAPCTFSLSLQMKNLREVVLDLPGAGPNGNCCSYPKSKFDDRKSHRFGLCLVHIGSLYRTCPNIQIYDGIDIGKVSQEKNTFPKWNAKVKKLFYDDYVKNGGEEGMKSWGKGRWFTRRPAIPEVFGRYRYPEPCLVM